MPTPTRVDRWFPPVLRRILATAVLSWLMMAVYMFINRRSAAAATVVEMPAWVPFTPAFLPPYLGLLLVTLLLPVAIRDRGRFRACLQAYAFAFVLVMPWWVLTPTLLPRPALPDGFWAHGFHWLWKTDLPTNVTPCAHAVGPIVAAWFAGREYAKWRWPLAVLLALTLPSIALVWQHRPVDIVLGAVAAGVGIVVAEALLRRSAVVRARADDDKTV